MMWVCVLSSAHALSYLLLIVQVFLEYHTDKIYDIVRIESYEFWDSKIVSCRLKTRAESQYIS